MFVKDTKGKWYEVEEKALKNKEVDNEKFQEVIIAERAERRKKVTDMISQLDNQELSMLFGELLELGWGRFGGYWRPDAGNCPECSCPECQCPECQCPECGCPECSCPECTDPSWNWGSYYRPGGYGGWQYRGGYRPLRRR